MRIIERRRQHVGVGVDLVERQPVLPRIERLRRHERRQAGDRVRMIGAELRRTIELRGAEEGAPVHPGGLLGEVILGPHACRLGEILALFTRGVRLGDLDLQIIDAFRLRIGVSDARCGQQLGDIALVRLTDARHLGVGRQIIFAFGKAETALKHIGDDLAGRRQPLRHEDAKQIFGVIVGGVQRIDVGADLLAQSLRQRRLVGYRSEAREIGGNGLQTRGVDRLGVGISFIESRDAALVGVGLGVTLDDRIDQFAGALLGFEEGRVEGSGRGAVGGNFGSLLPAAVRIGVEIVARLHTRIHRGLADAEFGADGVGRFLVGAGAGDGPRDDRGGGQQYGVNRILHGSKASLIWGWRMNRPLPIWFQSQPVSSAGSAFPSTNVPLIPRMSRRNFVMRAHFQPLKINPMRREMHA